MVSKIGLMFIGLLFALGMSATASANWTLNIGYHNPPGATLGVNFLYWGSKWVFETGIGWVDMDVIDTDDDKDKNDNDKDDNDDDTATFAILGDLNLKYFFRGGSFRPYLQGGFGAAVGGAVGKDSGLGADIGGGFVGVGLMMGSPSFHAYLSGNVGWGSFLQLGVGFDI